LPGGIFIDKNDVLDVTDSESREGTEGCGYKPGRLRGSPHSLFAT
jgi:hypothetical protein